MNNKHSIEDVLEAVDALLKYKREQKLKNNAIKIIFPSGFKLGFKDSDITISNISE